MKKENNHKATIETIVNTAAIALTTYGVSTIIQKEYYGFIVVIFGMILEFFKYWGRNKKLW